MLKLSNLVSSYRSEELVKRESKRNFFPVKTFGQRRRRKNKEENEEGVSTDFKENVGVTVIVPGGEIYRHV